MGQIHGDGRNLTLGGAHTMQYTDLRIVHLKPI